MLDVPHKNAVLDRLYGSLYWHQLGILGCADTYWLVLLRIQVSRLPNRPLVNDRKRIY